MPALIDLNTKLDSVQGVQSKFLPKLKKLGITTVGELLWHFPSRYEDYTKVSKISELKPGDTVTVRAEVARVSVKRSFKSRMSIVEVLVTDETGGISLVWFNQPFMSRVFSAGMRVNFAGKVASNKTGIHIYNPSYEILRGTAETTHTACLVPVYSETRGLTSKGLRHLIKTFLDVIKEIPDFIPADILKKNNLPELNRALRYVHFPKLSDQAERAKERFAFEYVFLIQLYSLQLKAALAKESAPKLTITQTELKKLLSHLPFSLTPSQKESLEELLEDIGKPHPMNRLLQGDVGSGKTVVAALAALIAAHKNKQAIFMAPTEVLARQHYQTVTRMFSKFAGGVALLTGSEARIYYEEGLEEKIPKASLLKKIESGEVTIIIGTHALISKSKNKTAKTKKGVQFHDPGLIIIDEQHRFGVKQRAALIESKEKTSLVPHFLSMSATPIPRTLSLAVFGDLDVSTINELPKGRKKILTKIVDPSHRTRAYEFIKKQLAMGRQAFFIYPRIEQNEADGDKIQNKLWSVSHSVKEEYERLKEKIFPDFEVGMLHGKMKSSDKEAVMADFRSGKIAVLISTSVIEVGVDVPNATMMIVEGAEYFGLAQLYQFRGRVGRGEHQSFCFLLTESEAETTQNRLNALLTAKNGFELAEKDLELRGPGQFLGDKQTGMPDLAMGSLNDIRLVKAARDSAQNVLADDPSLATHPLLKEKMEALNKEVHLE